ncbi:hypothetical protein ACFPM0_00025 [Pseudonocardia sulfidoxydans]
MPLEHRDAVPGPAQQGRLLVDDAVLTAGLFGAVAVVDDEDVARRAR